MPLIFKKIIFVAVILAIVFGFAFSLTQQVLRQGANDPQVQIARDAAAKLAVGEDPAYFSSNVYGHVDMAKSLAPFLITFDGAGKLLVANATLNGTTPLPPAGVLAYAKKHGENRITWQPAKGVRIAAVVTYYGGSREGYALSGRSLQEMEKRISGLQFMTFWAWLATTIIAIIGLMFIDKKAR
jgi:hypothetical protein